MHSCLSSFVSPTYTKRWADYQDDELLPIIPWAPHVKPSSPKSETRKWTNVNSETRGWTTVKSKKKRK